MSLDMKGQVLEAACSATCGVRDLVHLMKWKTSSVVNLLKVMSNESLIDLQPLQQPKRGRPKTVVVCTPLGLEFLEKYRRLKMMPLKARKEDLARAVKDAEFARRLVERGQLPFKVFMELNTIARNIEVSSQTPETV